MKKPNKNCQSKKNKKIKKLGKIFYKKNFSLRVRLGEIVKKIKIKINFKKLIKFF